MGPYNIFNAATNIMYKNIKILEYSQTMETCVQSQTLNYSSGTMNNGQTGSSTKVPRYLPKTSTQRYLPKIDNIPA